MFNFEEHKAKVEKKYSYLKDHDKITRLGYWSIDEDGRKLHITEQKITDQMIKLSEEISKLSSEYSKINTVFELIVSDYADINRYKMNRKVREKIFINDINRCFIHLLSSARLYISFIENHIAIKYGKKSENFNKFKELQCSVYNQSFAYRFFYYLRNFTQHIGLPITSVTEKLVNTEKGEQVVIEIYTDIDYLLNSAFDWKPILRKELEALQRITRKLDMFNLSAEYYYVFTRIWGSTKELYLEWNQEELMQLADKAKALSLDKYEYSICETTKFQLIYNPTYSSVRPLCSLYEIEEIYQDLSKSGLVKIAKDHQQ